MDNYLVWLIAGFILVIVELATTTFYLLVFGIAAFAGAGVAYAGGALIWQAIVAAAVAVAGVFWVQTCMDIPMYPLDRRDNVRLTHLQDRG